ncbi:MAG TPA: AtpZ/AtpI family protein [Acetobacteraceae bacterium]|jgi:ATP synthase protein I|nr:AtpZ/AtpI family protein [Acetobacteraceae bacterium]
MNEEPGDENQPPSFEERLKAARGRQGLDAPSSTSARDSGGADGMSPWGIGLRVGIELVSALVVAVAIGWGLGYLFGGKPIFIAVFVLLGGAAGILNVWRLFAPRPTRDRGR